MCVYQPNNEMDIKSLHNINKASRLKNIDNAGKRNEINTQK
jgi:hypothetical protein